VLFAIGLALLFTVDEREGAAARAGDAVGLSRGADASIG
jgi:hypothetical protein